MTRTVHTHDHHTPLVATNGRKPRLLLGAAAWLALAAVLALALLGVMTERPNTTVLTSPGAAAIAPVEPLTR